MHGGEDLALADGGGVVRGGTSHVSGEGVTRAEVEREQDFGNSLLAMSDISSTRQQHRTNFSTSKHTRSSYKPACICTVDFRLLRKRMGGRAWPMRLEVAWVRGGSSRAWGEGGGEGRATERARRRGLSPCYDRWQY